MKSPIPVAVWCITVSMVALAVRKNYGRREWSHAENSVAASCSYDCFGARFSSYATDTCVGGKELSSIFCREAPQTKADSNYNTTAVP